MTTGRINQIIRQSSHAESARVMCGGGHTALFCCSAGIGFLFATSERESVVSSTTNEVVFDRRGFLVAFSCDDYAALTHAKKTQKDANMSSPSKDRMFSSADSDKGSTKHKKTYMYISTFALVYPSKCGRHMVSRENTVKTHIQGPQ